MPDDLPCFQRLFHIDNPLVLRTAECQCHAVKFLNKLAVHEDIDQALQLIRTLTSRPALTEKLFIEKITGIAPDIFLWESLAHFL